MQNDKLFEVSLALILKSLKIIEQKIKKDLVFVTEASWVKDNDDQYYKQYSKRPVWTLIIHKSEKEIKSTKEYDLFSEIVNSDPIISDQVGKLVGTHTGKSMFEEFNIVSKLLLAFLTDTGVAKFNNSLFKATYRKIENDLYSDIIEYERLTPLIGFFMEDNNMVLENNSIVAKLSETEIIKLLMLGIKVGDIWFQEEIVHNINHFAIKLKYRLPKIVGDQHSEEDLEPYIPKEYWNIEQKILNVLRLFKDGKVSLLGSVTSSNNIFVSAVSYNIGITPKPFSSNKFQFIGQDGNKFLEFWKKYNGIKISEEHFLSVSIRRFSQANERDSFEDKIIDLLICAEALFLSSSGGSHGELQYRLSHRVAMFIANEPEEQRKIFKFMNDVYDLRSRIVHGVKLMLPKKKDGIVYNSLEDYCNELEAYLRTALLKAIDKASISENQNNFLDWDSIVFPVD